ncbi:MAG: AAA family ATPase [Candidatus Nitrosopolaris sp.]
MDIRKDGVYFGSNTTSRILDVLEEKRPKIICIDELDKMPKQFHKLLNFMESGRIKVDQMKRQYEIKGAKLFATCNGIDRLSKPMQIQDILHAEVHRSSLDVSVKVLPKKCPSIARYIGASVWKSQGDIRDVISIGKLVHKSDGPLEIEQIMNTMEKYRGVGRTHMNDTIIIWVGHENLIVPDSLDRGVFRELIHINLCKRPYYRS